MTREEFLEKVFQKKYEELKDKDLRIVRVKVKGKEISLLCPFALLNYTVLKHVSFIVVENDSLGIILV